MMFTLGCLSVLFGVLAMLWADGRLARGCSSDGQHWNFLNGSHSVEADLIRIFDLRVLARPPTKDHRRHHIYLGRSSFEHEALIRFGNIGQTANNPSSLL
jgi:hypothetical protein